MSDPVSLASLFEAAEQAAIGGDFAAAARFLAEAARIQHATLGPDHRGLANTLNNLAVAHERSGHLDDAEREYRRAYGIAARTLPPDDPLVTTSAQNLREFCDAHGRSVDAPVDRAVDAPALRLGSDDAGVAAPTRAIGRPPQTDAPTAPVEPLAMTFAAESAPSAAPAGPAGPAGPAPARPEPVRPAAAPARPAPTRQTSVAPIPTAPAAARPPAPATTPASRTSTTPDASARTPAPTPAPPARSRLSVPVLIALGAAAALVIWLLAGRGPAAPPATPEAAASEPSPPGDGPPASVPAPAAPAAGRPATPPPTSPAEAPAAPRGAAAAPAATSTRDGLTVGEAQLCATLSPGYRCKAAGAAVRPGPLTFYTRLVASQNTSVVHRWYRGSELRQSVRLQVPARRQGFRTFSRATVSPSEGEWRVELRSRDGQLLHAERFTVR